MFTKHINKYSKKKGHQFFPPYNKLCILQFCLFLTIFFNITMSYAVAETITPAAEAQNISLESTQKPPQEKTSPVKKPPSTTEDNLYFEALRKEVKALKEQLQPPLRAKNQSIETTVIKNNDDKNNTTKQDIPKDVVVEPTITLKESAIPDNSTNTLTHVVKAILILFFILIIWLVFYYQKYLPQRSKKVSNTAIPVIDSDEQQSSSQALEQLLPTILYKPQMDMGKQEISIDKTS